MAQTLKKLKTFWPIGNDQFHEGVDLYAEVMAEIDEVVTRMLFESHGVKYHDDHFLLTFHNLRLIKYKVPKKLGGDVVYAVIQTRPFPPSSIRIMFECPPLAGKAYCAI
ncbi:hypothetical protein L3X38_027110 [Prunus dulcis]|uniref:Uncharacterized protein n=1 Tax=Prunus dulcis TaxID=3755 RepID=A0AAD4Z031_PRUDU|nr:hypothetical protein L3X38_027110 [Prunus dulcis]